jgi:uncharacterized membrane protein YphA (DoxX/SURF4 family)
MIKEWGKRLFFGGAAALFLPMLASAHEVYVLNNESWQHGLAAAPVNLMQSLNDPSNLRLTLVVICGALLGLIGTALFTRSVLGRKIDAFLMSKADFGRFLLRLSLAAALFVGAQDGAMFGPEIVVAHLPLGHAIHYILYGLSVLTLFGWLTELVGITLVVIFALMIVTYGFYGFTYLSYLGEMLTLMLFGAGYYSIDRHLAKAKPRHNSHVTDLEALIIRVGYGLSLVYAAINIKFVHAAIPLEVVSQYHLNQFHWLFPPDPLLIVLGAGIVETVIGLFIVLGFQVRWVLVVFLFYLTLSLVFFGESVWPHYILYGISIYLIFTNGGRLLSLDQYILAAKK